MEEGPGRAFGIAARGQAQPKHERALGLEPRIHMAELREAPQEEAGARQERDREGHLRHRERAAHPAPAAREQAASAFAKGCGGGPPRGEDRGYGAEHDRGEEGAGHGEGDHHAVQPDLLEARHVAGLQQEDQIAAPGRDDQARAGPESTQHGRLREELAHEAAAARAHRRAHGELPLARRGARQQQVRDVRAGDQQDEAHRAEQDEERRAHLSDHGLVQRAHGEAHALVRIGIGGGQARADGGRLGPRRFGGGARIEAPDGREIPGPPALGTKPLVVFEGPPERAAAGEVEARRGHADDRVGHAVQDQGLAHRGGRGAEALPPEALAQHHHPVLAGLVFPGRKVRPTTGVTRSRSKKAVLVSPVASWTGSPWPVRVAPEVS